MKDFQKILNILLYIFSIFAQVAAFYSYSILDDYNKGHMALLYGILMLIFVILGKIREE